MEKDESIPRFYCQRNISGYDLNNELSRWLLNSKNDEVLKKCLYLPFRKGFPVTKISRIQKVCEEYL